MERAYRIVLADSNSSFRYDLKRILIENVELKVEEASGGLELLNLLKLSQTAPDLLIVDIFMTDFDGVQTVHQIKKTYPKLKVLIMSMNKEKEYYQQALSSGAEGYILKQDLDMEVIGAIEKIRQGGVYLSPLLSLGSMGLGSMGKLNNDL